jgi:hypothetical protein
MGEMVSVRYPGDNTHIFTNGYSGEMKAHQTPSQDLASPCLQTVGQVICSFRYRGRAPLLDLPALSRRCSAPWDDILDKDKTSIPEDQTVQYQGPGS